MDLSIQKKIKILKLLESILYKIPFVGFKSSRKENCWDNAVTESFFHTLKTEKDA